MAGSRGGALVKITQGEPMQYKVKKDPKAAFIISAVFGLLSIMFMYVSMLGGANMLLNQLIMLFCGAACVYVIIRYAIFDYVYVLSDDAPYKIEIVKVSGHFPKTLAVIDMSEKDMLIKLEKDTKIPQSIGKIYKKEDFCSNMFPKSKYLYVFEFESKKIAVKLEIDSEIAEILNTRINELKNKI